MAYRPTALVEMRERRKPLSQAYSLLNSRPFTRAPGCFDSNADTGGELLSQLALHLDVCSSTGRFPRPSRWRKNGVTEFATSAKTVVHPDNAGPSGGERA
jgi:hypothetical protein